MSMPYESTLGYAKQLFHENTFNGAALFGGIALIDYMMSLGTRYSIPREIVEHAPNEINAGDNLNQALLDLGVYNIDVFRSIQGWLSIRTQAAKSREDYTIDEIEQMLEGIAAFAKEFGLD